MSNQVSLQQPRVKGTPYLSIKPPFHNGTYKLRDRSYTCIKHSQTGELRCDYPLLYIGKCNDKCPNEHTGVPYKISVIPLMEQRPASYIKHDNEYRGD